MIEQNNKVLGCFDHAFLINAKESQGRLHRVSAELSRIGVQYELFEAIMPTVGTYKHATRVGCALSHMAVVKIAKDRGYKNVLVLEDDVIFRDNFIEMWNNLRPTFDTIDYDLFYFYDWTGDNAGKPYQIVQGRTYTTHCYALHSQFYDKFLATCEEWCRDLAVDFIMAHAMKECKKWITSPSLVGQREEMSMIENRVRTTRWGVANNSDGTAV